MLFGFNSDLISFLQKVCLLMVFLVVAFVVFGPLLGFIPGSSDLLTVEKSNDKQQTKLFIENATISSRDDQNRPVEIKAEKAIPQGADLEKVDLGGPKARLELGDGRSVDVQSNSGKYDRDANTLVLRGDVLIENSEGYKLETQSGSMSLDTNNFETNSDISGSGPAGTMSAEGMVLDQGSGKLVLKGRSELVFDVKQIRADQKARAVEKALVEEKTKADQEKMKDSEIK